MFFVISIKVCGSWTFFTQLYMFVPFQMVEQKVHTLEQRNRQLDEKEKTLVDLDARLNKKREQLNNMEQQLAKVSTTDPLFVVFDIHLIFSDEAL